MARIPMTAVEQLQRARDLGHELTSVTRTFPEHPDAPPKYYVTCSCGWEARVTRTRKAANSSMAWHLGKVIAESLDQRNGRRAV